MATTERVKVGGHFGGRPAPTAYVTAEPYTAKRFAGRLIVLSTSRGDMRIDPAEADALANALRVCAEAVRAKQTPTPTQTPDPKE
jgi:hypothetical protein